MKPILAQARTSGYAVGAFNTVDYASTRVAIEAAEDLNAPIIIQFSVKTVKYWGYRALSAWMNELAAPSPVPVAFHLDHCKDLSVIDACLKAGWTSVMIDASSLPFEENLALSRKAVERATAAGADVEAELGEIGGVEDDISVRDEDATLADPAKAEAFCKALDLAVFAPAIGTAHGVYKGEPKIAFDRLEEIQRRIDTPLALHGGTGLSDEIIQRCIGLGCAKINISTQLKHAFIDGFSGYCAANSKNYEPLKPLEAQAAALRAVVAEKIQQFGSSDRARSAKERIA
jgi:ketose-bisphosphate aldolase